MTEQPNDTPEIVPVGDVRSGDALDRFLNDLAQDANSAPPTHLPAEDATFTAEFVAVVKDTQPDVDFAAQLRQQLHQQPSELRLAASSKTTPPAGKIVYVDPYKRFRRMGTVAAILVVTLLAFLTVPPLRTFAQEMWDALFIRAESDVETYPTPTILPALEPTPTLAVIPTSPPADVDMWRAQVDFQINEPGWLPPNYVLHDVYASQEWHYASLFYYDDTGYGVSLIIHPLEYLEPLSVGASADIIDVDIHGVTGQYVPGGAWVMMTQQDGDTTIFNGEVWDSTIPHQQLRWVADGLDYRLSTGIAASNLTMDDLIRIAESVMP